MKLELLWTNPTPNANYVGRTISLDLSKYRYCVIDAKHLCVNSRGIRDIESSTVTAEFGGKFKEDKVRREFLDYIKLDTQF